MGRAPLGAAAKTRTGAVRVTETEFAKFQQAFGGLGKFLQMQVNDQLAKWADEQDERQRADISPKQVMK